MSEVRQWFAPGRVNLMGDHLDYNGGPVLPFAIDRGVTVKARRRDDNQVQVWTMLDGNQRSEFTVEVDRGVVSGWASYVAGVFWALHDAGHQLPGFDLVIDSDLPTRAGLSSSAALTCAVAGALNDGGGLRLDDLTLVQIAQKVENDFVGVPCGPMDQMVAVFGRDSSVLLITASESVESVVADWEAAGLALMVIDTQKRRELSDGRYAERRQECEEAAAQLDLGLLAQAGPDAILRLEDETLKARTRHVITESARTRGAVRALGAAAWTQLGAMMTASHASLRDDFEVSCLELDIAVDGALEAGALGARMTGAGFGGCAIALVPAKRINGLRERVAGAFAHTERPAPVFATVHPSPGLRQLP